MRREALQQRILQAFFGSVRWIAVTALLLTLAVAAIAAENRPVKAKVAPVYPELARRLKITGQVSVHVTIDPTGSVMEAKATNGNRMLTMAAEDAVKKWRFAAAESTTSQDVTVDFVAVN